MAQNPMKNQDSLQKTSPSIRGSVLVLILVAIALFGALSFAMTQGFRGGSAQLTDQQAKLAATEIIEYGSKIRNAIKTLLINGCTEYQINFANDTYKSMSENILYTQSHNLNSPADFRCNVFHQNGAGILPFVLPAQATSPNLSGIGTKPGHSNLRYVAFLNVGTEMGDIFIHISYVSKDVCLAFNALNNVPNINGNPPEYRWSAGGNADYDGTLSDTPKTLIDTDNVLSGKKEFCGKIEGQNSYHISSVVLAR